jgi:hypothetical protein
VFWIGTASLVLAGVLLATGTRRYFSVQKVLFALAVAGTLVLVAVMLLGSRDTFKANLHKLTGLDYAGVVATAKQNGYVTGSFNLGTSIKFLVFPLLPLLGAVQSIGLGGEVKRVRRSQLFGMLGTVAATGILIALFDGLAAKAFGYEFQGAIGFNSISGIADGSTEASVGASPWFTVLAGILTSNVILATVIMATFVAWIWFWVPAELAYTTRTMIAWSFDRLAPDRLGHVSERVPHPGGGHRPVDRRVGGVHVADRLPQHRLPQPDRGPGGGLGGGHGGGHPVPADPARAVPGLPGGRVADRRGPGDGGDGRPLAGLLRPGAVPALERPDRRRPDVHPVPPVAGVLDRARHRRLRRRLVPRHPGLPAPPGDRRRPRLPADPHRVMAGEAPRPGWAAVHDEAVALVAEAGARGQVLRLVGSTGIRLHCPPAAAALDRLGRPAKDIDLVCRHEDRKGLRRLLEDRGWRVDRDLLVAMEGRRYAFSHPERGLELDVFVDRMEFCHTIELRDRLAARELTVPVEDLLLQKLQIVRQTVTDRMDAAALLATHPVGESDDPGEAIDPGYVAGLLARDWGFHHTATANLAALRDEVAGNGSAATVRGRVDALLGAIEAAPKSVRWRARARVGERMQWWQDVDEREAVY